MHHERCATRLPRRCHGTPCHFPVDTTALRAGSLENPGFLGGSDARLCPGGRRCSSDGQTEEVPRSVGRARRSPRLRVGPPDRARRHETRMFQEGMDEIGRPGPPAAGRGMGCGRASSGARGSDPADAWICRRSQNLVSHHLRALRAASLVRSRRDGKMVLYALTEAGRALLSSVLADEHEVLR